MFELKEILDKQDNNILSTGLKILGIITKFVNDKEMQYQMQNYYYVLDQQIKELLFFQEALNSNASYELESCKSFIEKNYLLSIKNIQPKSNESIKYYREAIEWLNQYPHPQDIAKKKSDCYSKIADIIHKENLKEALANYHYALRYDENAKEIYDKMGNILSELGYKQLAIKFYKINNLFSEILGCFEDMLKHDPTNANLFLKKGAYLLSQELYEKAAAVYFLAMGLKPISCNKQDILSKAISALEKIPSTEFKPEYISLEERKEDILEIIGDYHEI